MKNKIIIKFITAFLALTTIFTATCGCGNVVALQKEGGAEKLYYNGDNVKGEVTVITTLKPAPELPEKTEPKSESEKQTDSGDKHQDNPRQNAASSATTDTKPTSVLTTKDAAPSTPKPEATTVTTTTPPTSITEAPITVTTPTSTEATPSPETTPVTTTQVKPETSPAETKVTKPETTSAETTIPEEKPDINGNYTALNHSEVKGLWITYFELYPILFNKTAEEFSAGISEYYDNAKSIGINTVFVHVRPYGDALYNSDYYPWSKFCTGSIGEKPDFDPLEIMIEQAHKRGISFHAWINPMRCYNNEDIADVPDSFTIKKWYNAATGQLVRVNDYWYLNPAYKEVRELIADGAAEIAEKYNVDGIHIDDYFYPTKDIYFDYDEYMQSDYDDLALFRQDNCSAMISDMYKAIHQANNSVLFGISPQGNITNDKEELYADVEKWCKNEGYCDYFAPQIYYGFENEIQPYTEVVDEWNELVSGTDKKLICGLAVYKIGNYDEWAGSGSYEWINNTEMLKRQIEYARTADTYHGIILYSYQFIFAPESDVAEMVENEIDAIIPIMNV